MGFVVLLEVLLAALVLIEMCEFCLKSKDGEQIEVINTLGTVNNMCFDLSQDAVIAACHDLIKIFDLETCHLVQTCMGHHDSVRYTIFSLNNMPSNL